MTEEASPSAALLANSTTKSIHEQYNTSPASALISHSTESSPMLSISASPLVVRSPRLLKLKTEASSSRTASPTASEASLDEPIIIHETELFAKGHVKTFLGRAECGYEDGSHDHKQAILYSPYFLTIHPHSKNLYVAEMDNFVIRRFNIAKNCFERVAGAPQQQYHQDGRLKDAKFHAPRDLCFNSKGNLYVADHNCIRKICFATETVITVAGAPAHEQGVIHYADGHRDKARFSHIKGITIDSADNLYVCDTDNHRIRKISPTGDVTTVAGNGNRGDKDGNLLEAEFNGLWKIAINTDNEDELFVSDYGNDKIKKICLRENKVCTIAGSCPGYADHPSDALEAQFSCPQGLYYYDNSLFVADWGNHVIRRIELQRPNVQCKHQKKKQHSSSAAQQPQVITLSSESVSSPSLYSTTSTSVITGSEAEKQTHGDKQQSNADSCICSRGGKVSTVVGSGIEGLLDSHISSARLNYPYAVVIHSTSSSSEESHPRMYISDEHSVKFVE